MSLRTSRQKAANYVFIGTNTVEENKIFYVQYVFSTRVSIFDIIVEKMPQTLIFKQQHCENIKSRRSVPFRTHPRAKSKQRGSLIVFRTLQSDLFHH